MPSEAQMWSALRGPMQRLGLDPVRVENPAMPGTPDVNYREGWIELKHADRWPPRGGPLRLPHPPTPEQRAWLYRRWEAGGTCSLLVRVGQEWLVFLPRTAFQLWREPDTLTRGRLYEEAWAVRYSAADAADFYKHFKNGNGAKL